MNNNIAIDVNRGFLGVVATITEVNFLDGIKVLHELYGMSYKVLARLSGVNYNTLRACAGDDYNSMSYEKTVRAVVTLKANILGIR